MKRADSNSPLLGIIITTIRTASFNFLFQTYSFHELTTSIVGQRSPASALRHQPHRVGLRPPASTPSNWPPPSGIHPIELASTLQPRGGRRPKASRFRWRLVLNGHRLPGGRKPAQLWPQAIKSIICVCTRRQLIFSLKLPMFYPRFLLSHSAVLFHE